VHALRGLPSNRKIPVEAEQEAVAILKRPVYRGFGPTLASEYLAKKHGIEVSRKTVRQWMIQAKLWRARQQQVEKIHEWRPRRSRFGELVQVATGIRGATVRVEKRRDGEVAVRFRDRYLSVSICEQPPKLSPPRLLGKGTACAATQQPGQ
jgi:hypothetical protein